MTDRELLELAAKACGLEEAKLRIEFNQWNPLTDDGDALRLAVQLRLEIGFPSEDCVWSFGRFGEVCKERPEPYPYAATRRAIVRAAAEIGRTTP